MVTCVFSVVLSLPARNQFKRVPLVRQPDFKSCVVFAEVQTGVGALSVESIGIATLLYDVATGTYSEITTESRSSIQLFNSSSVRI